MGAEEQESAVAGATPSMNAQIDPYREWLGRTCADRPLNYYQLLGLRDLEDDRGRIENAEMIEMAKVLRHEAGPHADLARRLSTELEQAIATLLDPARKAAYDAQLRAPQTTAASPSPSNYYQLLNLKVFESDAGRIETAHMLETGRNLRMSGGADVDKKQELLDLALATLTDPRRKAAYDAQLRPGLAAAPPAAPVASSSQKVQADATLPDCDAAADLKLGDEAEVEDDFVGSSPKTEPDSVKPEPVQRVAPAAVAAAVRAPQADNNDDDDGLAPRATQPQRSKKQVYSSYAPKPIEKSRKVSVSLPSVSLMPLVKVGGGIAAVLLLGWGAMKVFNTGEPVGQLHGKVTLDGQPVIGAEMRLEATENPDLLFVGITGSEGVYQLSYRVFEGLPIGRYKIMITRRTRADGKPLTAAEGEEETPNEDSLVTTNYVFERDVTKGANDINLELSQGEKLKPQG